MADCKSPGEGVSVGQADAEKVLRPLVTCGICQKIYVDPVALLNCLHLACGSCAIEHLKHSTACPQCQETVYGAHDSHSAAAAVEAYRDIAPNSHLCQARTPEEIASLRQKYQPGQLITVQPGQLTAQPEQSTNQPEQLTNQPEQLTDQPEQSTDQPEQSTDQPEQLTATQTDNTETYSDSQLGTRGSPPPTNWGAVRFHNNSCPFCDPSNESGFVCPRPCPQEPSGVGRRTVPVGHTTCGECNRFLPLREDLPGSKCVVCTQTTCSQMGQTCYGHASQIIQLSKLRDVELPSWRGIPLAHAFGDIVYERNAFRAYADEHGLNLQTMFRQILDHCGPSLPRATWHGRAFDASRSDTVNLDDVVCTRCASDLVGASLFEWWLSQRAGADLPDGVTSRSDCPNGIECHVARSDPGHAAAYNHICRPTEQLEPESRESNDSQPIIPEGGNRYETEGSSLSGEVLAFGPSNILFRDKGNEPVFLCSSICSSSNGTATIPGKTTLWEHGTTVYYGLDGQEYTHNGVVRLLLDTRNMHWVRTSQGIIPEGHRPVVGGHMNLDGTNQELYHCVVWWRGQRIPGYTSTHMRHAAITWHGSMWYLEDHYELLCWD